MLKEKITSLKELCEKVCFKITQDDKIISSSPYEICVFCGKETDVRKDSYIDNRATYVDGAGQLCTICYSRIYKWRLISVPKQHTIVEWIV